MNVKQTIIWCAYRHIDKYIHHIIIYFQVKRYDQEEIEHVIANGRLSSNIWELLGGLGLNW
jgi:hypothetical protein